MKVLGNFSVPSEPKIKGTGGADSYVRDASADASKDRTADEVKTMEVEIGAAEVESSDDDESWKCFSVPMKLYVEFIDYKDVMLDRKRCFRRLGIKKLKTKDQWLKYYESVFKPFLEFWNCLSYKVPCPLFSRHIAWNAEKKFEEYVKCCEFLKKDINLDDDDDNYYDIYLKLRPKIKYFWLTRRWAMLYVKRHLSSENAKIEQFQEFMLYLVENWDFDFLKILEEASRNEQEYPLISWEWRTNAVELLYEWIVIDVESSDSLEQVNQLLRQRIEQYCCDMKKGEHLVKMKDRSTEHQVE